MENSQNKLMPVGGQNAAPAVFNFFDPVQFDTMQRVCDMFINSELVPKIYQNQGKTPESRKKAIANCMIALETAQRIGASPLMVMQNMYIVYGQPAWSSKFLIATVNSCGRFNSLKYKWENLGKIKINGSGNETENWQCIAYTTEKGRNEELQSIPVTVEMAIKEGWYTKNGSKWQTMPKLMLQYRAATLWTRVYAPELSMGLKTDDEIMDITDIQYEEIKANGNGNGNGKEKALQILEKAFEGTEEENENPGEDGGEDTETEEDTEQLLFFDK